MTLQSKSKITCIARLVLASMFLAVAWISASAQTNTFPSSGNAGVGTTTPTLQSGVSNTIIEVKGSVNPGVGLTSTAAGGRQYYVYSSQANPGYFSVFDATATADRLVIGSSGNVGIGTPSPKTKLDIKQSEDTFVGGLHLRRSSTNDTWALATGNDNSLYMGYANNASGADAGSDFTVYPLVLTGGGNVGVGTAAPGHKLDVQGGSINSSAGLCIAGDCKTAWSQVGGGGGSSQWTGTSSIYYNGGNVGIGTSTPASNLQIGSQVAGATGAPVTMSLGGSYSNSAGNNFKIKLYDDATPANTYGIGVSYASMDFGVGSTGGYNWYSGGSHRMTLNGSGNVGIGNSSPTEKLHVTGNVSVTGTGNITASGTIEGGNIKAKYQDLAEWVPSSEQLAAGTVVVLDTSKSNQVISSTRSYDTRVAGVISAQPGITLGEGGEGKVLVATTGRVRVKVDASRGAIQIGDLLVTSDVSGVAMKSEAVKFAGRKMHMPGTIIGKALEPMAKGKGEILVLLSLQ